MHSIVRMKNCKWNRRWVGARWRWWAVRETHVTDQPRQNSISTVCSYFREDHVRRWDFTGPILNSRDVEFFSPVVHKYLEVRKGKLKFSYHSKQRMVYKCNVATVNCIWNCEDKYGSSETCWRKQGYHRSYIISLSLWLCLCLSLSPCLSPSRLLSLFLSLSPPLPSSRPSLPPSLSTYSHAPSAFWKMDVL